ncbi:MAG: ROK family protein [Alphaproteobacteria bacterium]|nr:ROK family protein [Alphaproteobacteria bacterium]
MREGRIGVDIGGTKIAVALYSQDFDLVDKNVFSTPNSYPSFLKKIVSEVLEIERKNGFSTEVGVAVPGGVDVAKDLIFAPNLSFTAGKHVKTDISKELQRDIHLANDANCMALAEALYGAGKGYPTVFGLILGTGVGGGFVWNGKILNGVNGLAGEIGHIALSHRADSDGQIRQCGCGQKGDIESSLQGAALSSLFKEITGEDVTPIEVSNRAKVGDSAALCVLSQYFEIVAKSMVSLIYTFDPEIIVVSGGLNLLPGLYEEVPKRWDRYCVVDQIKTKFVPAQHGAMAGLLGAALLCDGV